MRSCGLHSIAGVGHAGERTLPRRRKGVTKMIIDCAHYQDGRRRDAGAVPLEEAAARCGQGGFVWLGLFEPSDEELAQVQDTFGLHELAVEFGEISVFVAPTFVITVRQGVASELHKARQRLEQRPELLATNSFSAVW